MVNAENFYNLCEGFIVEDWFSKLKEELEAAYLASDEPWGQSGFSGSHERWEALRKPVADCIDKSGTFLDIGCANGYLLECLIAWSFEKAIEIVPYGIDLSEKLVALARNRLPDFSDNIFVGNGLTWEPPIRFDYVRTELCYVPEDMKERYVRRLHDEFLKPDGKLLVADYRSKGDDPSRNWCDIILKHMGFEVSDVKSGFWGRRELMRVGVII